MYDNNSKPKEIAAGRLAGPASFDEAEQFAGQLDAAAAGQSSFHPGELSLLLTTAAALIRRLAAVAPAGMVPVTSTLLETLVHYASGSPCFCEGNALCERCRAIAEAQAAPTPLRELPAKWRSEAREPAFPDENDRDAVEAHDAALEACADELEAALSARDAAGAVECPHEAWEELGGWCRCVDCGHGWRASTPPASGEAECPTPPADRAPGGEVMDAAYHWWLSRRPLAFNEAEHLDNPEVNTCSDAEKALAKAVAAALAARTGKGESDGR